MQRAILGFKDLELRSAKAMLQAELAEQQQQQQAANHKGKNNTVMTLPAERATLQGRIGQMETDLAADRERKAARTRFALSTLNATDSQCRYSVITLHA